MVLFKSTVSSMTLEEKSGNINMSFKVYLRLAMYEKVGWEIFSVVLELAGGWLLGWHSFTRGKSYIAVLRRQAVVRLCVGCATHGEVT